LSSYFKLFLLEKIKKKNFDKKRITETFSRERESDTELKHNFEKNSKGLKNIEAKFFNYFLKILI
jgi:hypothetical protein